MEEGQTQKNTLSAVEGASAPGLPEQARGDSPMSEKLRADGRYYWFLVAYLVVLSALGSFVNDMYTPSLPAMTRFFHCSVPTVQMGLTMGMVGLAVGQFLLGPLSDRYGRRPVLIGSVALFIAAAAVSVFSPTIQFFVACRLFQGIGASGGYFLARTIPADVYSGRNLARLMALVGAINGVAPASAPVVGGFTADAWGWKGVFIVLAIFAGAVLAVSPMLKESLAPSRRVTGGIRRSIEGYKSLILNKPFIIHVCFKGTALGLLFAYISSSPFILQNHYGLTQTGYGLLIGFNALFMAAGSMIALKFKPLKKAAFIGSLILAGGVAGEAVALYCIHSLVIYEIFTVMIVFALGLIFATANTLAMNEGRDRAGEASSVLGISGYVVGAIVSPLVGLGDVLHSTANTYIALAVVIIIFSLASRSLAPDLDK